MSHSERDIGGRLRQARAARGWSIADLARLTRLSPIVLRAIEGGDFDSLPPGMYRKAYLRTFAAEVGLDADQICADYEAMQNESVDPSPMPTVSTGDRLVEELAYSRRRNITSFAIVVTLAIAWFTLGPDAVPRDSETDNLAAIESPVSAIDSPTPAAPPDVQPVAAVAIASRAAPLKIELTTVAPCWVAAESDGVRVVYEVIEPGKQLVLEGRRRISLRLGDAGAVRLSINGEPEHTPGADGEVVELNVSSDALHAVDDGAMETES